MRLILAGILTLMMLSGNAQFYYGLNQEFGKNRLQFQPFTWTYYGFDKYQVYLYEGGQEVAKYVSKQTEKHLLELEKKLDFEMEDKIQVLVYTTMGDFRQTNLGLSIEESGNIGGVTKITGTKIHVYFNGNHSDLDKQIRAGITEVIINDMMYGGRARDMVKNSTLLVLPDWFKNGLISYFSEPWSVDLDNKVYDGIKNDRYFNFNKLNTEEAETAGHALWSYIADSYGESVIPNILYMTKISRSVESGLNFVLGNNVRGLTYEWIDSFARKAMFSDSTRYLPKEQMVIENPKTYRNYYQLKIQPQGKKVAYVTNEMSQYKVWVKELNEHSKPKQLMKWGPKIERINDISYPLLAWHPKGNGIAVVTEKKGVIYLNIISINEKNKTVKPITGIEKVNDFAYSPDGKRLILSAVKKGKGQSDIFIYTINAGGLEQITNDVWDDNYPRFINGGNQLVFSSNRINDTLKDSDNARYDYEQSKFNDLFMFDYTTKSKALLRITNTPDLNETHCLDFDKGYFFYLSDQNGIRNRFVAKMDSVISYVDTVEHYRYTFYPKIITNYKRNIIEHDYSTKSNKIAETFYDNGRVYMCVNTVSTIDELPSFKLQNTPYRVLQSFAPKHKSSLYTVKPIDKTITKNKNIDTDNYTFKGDSTDKLKIVITEKETNNALRDTVNSNPESKGFTLPIQRNYYVNFSVDNIVSQLDNSFLNQTYQRFTGYYLNPGINGFFKVSLSDLFEDYRIVGGFRIAGSLNNEFFVSIENRKKLWDKQLILHRQSFININAQGNALLKIHTHDAQFRIKYPFSEVLSLKTTLSYRNDRRVYTALDDITLNTKNEYDNWAGIKSELVFDNTINMGLNLFRGNRSKVFAEYYRRIDVANLGKRNDLIVIGFDFRNYTKIHRNLIWANRLAGSTSLGTDRLIYYLGGVDNWFGPKFDYTINILHPEKYQFQTIATNMRGFKQNARNGNNFVVFNSELRFPIFRYLINRPIKSDFINNFQLIAFTDVGAAWYGKSPFSEENTENKTYIYGSPITVVLFQYKQPIIIGNGFGVRSRLFGYFFRVDFSWGYDNKERQDRLIYLSFTTDF